MCGLVGIWRHDGGEADRQSIEAMLAPIVHRGPDGKGVWQNGRVAFGHVRLAIIDPTEASAQPMLTEDGTGVLAYNGEVYNYRELRTELERAGVRFQTSGEVEVVLLALHHWGVEESVKRFDGMFAFAYFDGRDQTLWLGRDRVGIKPLLVADTGKELLFGSEAKALLAHPRMTPRADRHAVAEWIFTAGLGPHESLFEGIDTVEAGSIWRINEQGIDRHRYFHILDALDVDRLVANGGNDLTSFVDTFRDLIGESVKLHLVSDVPLAAACSGGVDSSLIAAVAKRDIPELTGYVVDAAGSRGEGAQAERVGRHLGVPINRIGLDQTRFIELWPGSVWHSDGPPTHPSDPALLAMARECKANGITVLLTGEGSDELFGGYEYFEQTYRTWVRRSSWRRFFLKASERDRSLNRIPFSTMLHPKLHNVMAIAMNAERELLPRRLLALLAPVTPSPDRAFLAHCLWSLHHYLPWILHRHDRIGMAASIEMRVPFLENKIFDFAFHLPRRAKFHHGGGKWVVKQVAAEALPRDIVYARKKGFPIPGGFSRGTQRLLAGGMLAELMKWPRDTEREIIAIINRNNQLRFQAVSMELWARIFFRGEDVSVLADQLVGLARRKVRRKTRRRTRRTGLGALVRRAGRALQGRS